MSDLGKPATAGLNEFMTRARNVGTMHVCLVSNFNFRFYRSELEKL
jgi:hypothetical protein